MGDDRDDDGAGRPDRRWPPGWYVACLSSQLRRRPLARTVLGRPLVLFRDDAGRAAALVDRCPHRNVPLSAGRVRAGELECGYHGWRFAADGACRAVPGLCAPGRALPGGHPERDVVAHRVVEQDGLVWVDPEPAGGPRPAPASEPARFPLTGEAGYATVWQAAQVDAPLVAALENTLDVPHTGFTHRGLFRTGRATTPVRVQVRSRPDGVEARYVGEPRPGGLAGRFLAPADAVVDHVDRFLLPSLAQVEYRLHAHHLVITTAYTPIDEARTALHAAVTFRVGLPPALVRAVLTPVGRRILAQDAAVLARQQANVARFGGPRFTSTAIDVLGAHVAAHLRHATDPDAAPAPHPVDHEVVLYT